MELIFKGIYTDMFVGIGPRLSDSSYFYSL